MKGEDKEELQRKWALNSLIKLLLFNYDESGVVSVNILSNQIPANLRIEFLTEYL